MSNFYRRQRLAFELASRLLKPAYLDEGLRSGVFLVGARRIGKTTFLRNDLIPELKARGAVVVYVDLLSDSHASPSILLRAAVRQAISGLSESLRRIVQENKSKDESTTLGENLAMLVDQSRTDVVLIVDEVIQATLSDEGNHMLLAMKAARDAINTRPNTPGHFLLLGCHSQHATLNDLTMRPDQAFTGATVLPYPLLDRDYVRHVLEHMRTDGITELPSEQAAWAGFQALQYRPEEFLRALRQWHSQRAIAQEPDQQFEDIVKSQMGATADMAALKVEQIGELARAIFDWAAAGGGEARAFLTNQAKMAISTSIGRPVQSEEMQSVVNELTGANLISRLRLDEYIITDPVVLQIWQGWQDWQV
ncbi:MAG: ATP-binding protein [Cyanobium sp.]